jgi:hypothetical protein
MKTIDEILDWLHERYTAWGLYMEKHPKYFETAFIKREELHNIINFIMSDEGDGE